MAAPLLYDATGTPVAGIDPDVAVQILPYGVDRGRWLAVRRTGIGGSDVSALVGLSKFESTYELWEDKTGRLPLVDEQSEDAEMGTLLEPVVRDRFARIHDVRVEMCGMLRSQQWPWMLANPDGLIVADRRGYEGKTCTLWKAHEWGSEYEPLVPDHAELQAQWCMAVTGWDAWWVACLIGGQRNVYRFVERDDKLIATLVEISGRFWRDNVLADVEPDLDGSDACTRLLTERFPVSTEDEIADVDEETRDELVIAREKAVVGEKAAKADSEAVKNRVRHLMGDAERLLCGDEEIATWKTTAKFKQAEFRKSEPTLAAEFTRQVMADVLDVDALKAAHPDTYRRYCSRVLQFKD